MLAIRMQRTGRKGHAQFRMIVQDSRFNPSSGRVVAFVGSYNPHNKAIILDKEKVAGYLAKGAQPTDRVAGILKAEGVKLPEWVSVSVSGSKTTKSPEKLRRNRPVTPDAPADKPSDTESASGETAESVEAIEAVESVESAEVPANAEPTAAEEKPAETAATTDASEEVAAADEVASDEKPSDEATA